VSGTEILIEDQAADGVVVLTLNRPDSRNALSRALRLELVGRLQALAGDDAVAVVVLTGSGETFCAGFDLKELSSGDAGEIFADAQEYHRIVHEFSKPLVAAVNGPALAGGMDLALMCDIRLGCPASRFGQPQVRMGIPAAYDLLRSASDDATARYLCLTGNRIDADEAMARGILVRTYADPDELSAQALACASTIAQGGAMMKARFLEDQPKLFQ